MSAEEEVTTRALIGAGFLDVERARRFLAARELKQASAVRLVKGLAMAADPDQALMGLVRLAERAPGVVALADDVMAHRPLFRLLGASEALGDFLARHPEHLGLVALQRDRDFIPAHAEDLRAELLLSVGADPEHAEPIASLGAEEATAALRSAYRAALVDCALRDVSVADPAGAVGWVAVELADLAGAAVEAALAVARAEVAQAHPELDTGAVHLAIMGMGKCGARELNYISDVDVIYVHGVDQDAGQEIQDAAASIATELAKATTRAVSAPGKEPALWELDANLRPEGKDGALSRSIESHVSYLERWARDWEFQALLKARTIAGCRSLGQRYQDAVGPLIWSSSQRPGFVESVQQMRSRVTDNIPAAEVDRQIKLGPGGLRDVEFTVQLLQLVHARVDESLRVRGTLPALKALGAAAYISRDDAAEFSRDYKVLRVMEHRIQLTRMRRTHLMPTRENEQRALARGVADPDAMQKASASDLLKSWRKVKQRVRGLHQKLFFRPLLATAARLGDEEVRLSPEAAQARLAALGYADPRQAMRHIEALTTGVSRTASLQRQLLPVLLGWMAEGVDPDAALLGFRRLSDSLGGSHWFLGMLRDSPAGAERLCRILGTSRLVTDLLEVSPEASAWLGDDRELEPESWDRLWTEISSKLRRHQDDPDGGMRLVRVLRQREQLRTALADGAGLLGVEGVGPALADADRAAVLGALRVAEQREFLATPQLTHLLVVAMGRQGGREIGYGSDADVLFVHEPLEGADPEAAQAQALRLAQGMAQMLQKPLKPPVLAERKLQLDSDLRPEGRQGPLVRTVDSYAEYYTRWAEIWERQALIRARPLAGSDDVAAAFAAVIDPVRYERGLSQNELFEIRRIKARVEGERLPRGADPKRHLKLGPGGLSDVEWLVQTLQLRHAGDYPELRVTGTLAALRALAAAELLTPAQAAALESAWLLASDARAAVVACTGRAGDSLPTNWQELQAVAQWTGYGKDHAVVLEEDWLRTSRRARAVFEDFFYPGGM